MSVAGNESMRASDGDRNQVVDLLREALDDGRLMLPEYDERVATAYRSVTYADLNVLLADLPQTRPEGVLAIPTPKAAARLEPPATAAHHRRMPLALMILWTIWGSITALNIVVWILVGVTHGWVYPWPVWLAVPGIALLGVTIGVDWMRTHRTE
jgi:Domain of unknown function (DUF1707)